MKVLFGVCSWGLGHATRDLPFIQEMINRGYELTIIGRGRSLIFLEKELEENCSYLDIPDYSSPYSKKDLFVAKFIAYSPIYVNEITKEHTRIKKIIKKERYDRIISDNRFGIYYKDIPSYFLSHQLRFIVPGRIKPLERGTERFNYFFKKKFHKFLVPDYAENSLSGDLSHNLKYFKKDKIEYLGPLSDLKKRKVEEDIDYFISLSGPEPQRTLLEKKILKQAPLLKGKVIIALGKPEIYKEEKKGNLHIFTFLNRKKQEEIMNRSRLVITRAGYTTLMELVILGKKALLIPTPGQTEQIYLAKYHKERGNFYSVSQNKLDLPRDVEEARKYPGLNHNSKENAVEKFMEIVFEK